MLGRKRKTKKKEKKKRGRERGRRLDPYLHLLFRRTGRGAFTTSKEKGKKSRTREGREGGGRGERGERGSLCTWIAIDGPLSLSSISLVRASSPSIGPSRNKKREKKKKKKRLLEKGRKRRRKADAWSNLDRLFILFRVRLIRPTRRKE